MDYEALKEQWSDIEDKDGIRLSWNTFPSSRMVRLLFVDLDKELFLTASLYRKLRDWLSPLELSTHLSRRRPTHHFSSMSLCPASSPAVLS